MLADVTPYLACPHCRQGLTMADGTLRWDRGTCSKSEALAAEATERR